MRNFIDRITTDVAHLTNRDDIVDYLIRGFGVHPYIYDLADEIINSRQK